MVDGRYTYTRQLKFLKGVPELDGWCRAHIMGGLNFLAPDKAERAEWGEDYISWGDTSKSSAEYDLYSQYVVP